VISDVVKMATIGVCAIARPYGCLSFTFYIDKGNLLEDLFNQWFCQFKRKLVTHHEHETHYYNETPEIPR
jgi:hypothetical protein